MNSANQPQLSGQVALYTNPEPLSIERHGHLGISAIDRPFDFLKETHVIPVMINEFAAAALSYPIIFAGDNRAPLAVMGLKPGENLAVLPDGNFDQLSYLPAYVRRYPFVFAQDDDNQRLVVCLETNSPLVSNAPQTPFFDNGQPSAYTQNAIEFLQEFEKSRVMTDSFVALMNDLDLWEPRKQVFTPPPGPDGRPGREIPLADYFAISQDKLSALPIDKIQQLNETGALGAIYAHLTSLIGWDRMVMKAAMRAG